MRSRARDHDRALCEPHRAGSSVAARVLVRSDGTRRTVTDVFFGIMKASSVYSDDRGRADRQQAELALQLRKQGASPIA